VALLALRRGKQYGRIATFLATEGWTVVDAPNGVGALSCIGGLDVVIVEQELRAVAATHLREFFAAMGDRVPSILIREHVESEEPAEASVAGVRAVASFPKPVDLDGLKAVLQEIRSRTVRL